MRLYKVEPVHQECPKLLEALKTFSSEEVTDRKDCVLEVLEAIPLIMKEEKIVIEDEVRAEFVAFAIANLQIPVMELISQASEAPEMSKHRKYQIVKCFEGWLQLNSSDKIKENLHKIKAIDLCFAVLAEPVSCNEEASDALMSVMIVCKDSRKYKELYWMILQNLKASQEVLWCFEEQGYLEEVRCYIDVYNTFILNVMDDFLAEPESPDIANLLHETLFRLYKTKNFLTVNRIVGVFISFLKRLDDEEGEVPTVNLITSRKNFIAVHKSLLQAIIDVSCSQVSFTTREIKFYQDNPFEADPNDESHEDRLVLRKHIRNLVRKISEKLPFIECMHPIAARLLSSIEELKTKKVERLVCKLEGELYCAQALLKTANNQDKLSVDTVVHLLEVVFSIDMPVHSLVYVCIRIMGSASPFLHQK